MSRQIVLGNGSMMVGLDEYGLVHDFYYPYVGLENHCTAKNIHHLVGVWVNGKFSWLDDGSWETELDYENDAMIGSVRARNKEFKVELKFTDFVDANSNVFGREVAVVNKDEKQREIRLFMHQVFIISQSSRGDTAQFIPDENLIIDYKGHRTFAVYGETEDGQPFEQYSIGIYGIEGKEGTFKDAEDGNLEGNAVEHGSVDTVIGFKLNVEPHQPEKINYFISCGVTNVDTFALFEKFKKDGFSERLKKTREFWQKWLHKTASIMSKIDDKYKDKFVRCLFIAKAHIDKRGSVLASGDSAMLNYERDNYSYCWPRDAAYVLWPFIRLGFYDEARSFFEFARDVLEPDGYLMHKYQPDRALGSSWHPYIHNRHRELPIQEDETAIVLFLLGEYLNLSKDEDFVRNLYRTFVKPAADFLDKYIDDSTKLPHASYDLWEEKFLTSTYTTSVVYAALISSARMAELFEFPDDAIRWQNTAEDIKFKSKDVFFNNEKGYFYKGFLLDNGGKLNFDATIDSSSLFGAIMYKLFDTDDAYVECSVRTLERELVDYSPSKGVPRYENDHYHATHHGTKGNPWFVTTLWYAQYYIETGKLEKAHFILDWCMSHMYRSGVLSEQIDPNSGNNLSVAPLVWSQAEFMNTVLDLTD